MFYECSYCGEDRDADLSVVLTGSEDNGTLSDVKLEVTRGSTSDPVVFGVADLGDLTNEKVVKNTLAQFSLALEGWGADKVAEYDAWLLCKGMRLSNGINLPEIRVEEFTAVRQDIKIRIQERNNFALYLSSDEHALQWSEKPWF